MPWFEVTAERFDWTPSRRVVVRYPQGGPHYGTRACVEAGEAAGRVVRLEKAPKGWRVGKDGKPHRAPEKADDGE